MTVQFEWYRGIDLQLHLKVKLWDEAVLAFSRKIWEDRHHELHQLPAWSMDSECYKDVYSNVRRAGHDANTGAVEHRRAFRDVTEISCTSPMASLQYLAVGQGNALARGGESYVTVYSINEIQSAWPIPTFRNNTTPFVSM